MTVYFAQYETPDGTPLPFVKIGYTGGDLHGLSPRTAARARLQEFGFCRLLAVRDGGRTEERALHRRFAALRTRGEWFHYREPLTSHVRELLVDEQRRAQSAYALRSWRTWVDQERSPFEWEVAWEVRPNTWFELELEKAARRRGYRSHVDVP